MSQKAIIAWAAGLAALLLVGCAGEPEVKESETSKQMAAESAGKWTPEMKDAFKKAHDRAKKGEDK